MTYEKERDEAAESYRTRYLFAGNVRESRIALEGFNRGSDWAHQRAEKKVQGLIKALLLERESPRELCALMAEGEGSNPKVYQTMANAAMGKIDKALEEFKKDQQEDG